MSESRRRRRADPYSRVARRARVLVALIGFLAVLTTAVATPVVAYWTGTGSGSGSAATGTLAAPTGVTVPGTAARDVPVSWTPGVGGVVPGGYYVTRHTGQTVAAACGSGPTALVAGPSCTDLAVPSGTSTYVVTAVYRTWTAPSAPSGPVTVENAAAVAFLVEPTDTVVNTPVTPAVTVALRTTGGASFQRAGVTVTIALGNNPVGGILTGVTTALTDVFGVATFTNLVISTSGVGYTLTATSADVTSGTSAPFTVSPPPILGAAQSFSVLAGTAVVNVGVTTTVSGDVGVSPGTSITGFPTGSIGGDIHADDAAAVAAQAALLTTYSTLTALPRTSTIAGDMIGLTLTPGVYYSAAALALTGTVTLDGAGDPNAIFIFQINAAFNTAAGSSVVLINGARAANVYWVALGAAGTGAGAVLSGNILAEGAITLGAGTVLIGRALSRDAVTLASNTIRFTAALPPTIGITGGNTATTKDTAPVIAGTSNAPRSSPVTVSIAGQMLSTTVGSDGTWSVTAATLTAGIFEVVARVRDPAGNGAAATQQLTVEVNPAPVNLGTAGAFAVLAATSVVSTGATVVNGDLGVSPGVAVTGFPDGVVNGGIHVNDAIAAAAQVDLLAAISEVSGRAPHTEIVGNLGGRTFHLGIHHQADAMALTGTVTLDAEGNPAAIFIFQAGAAFDTAAASSVVLAGGAQAANVYWVVTGAAGTGADSSLPGTVLARGAITVGANTVLTGRALSLGVVTLAANTITRPGFVGFARRAAVAGPTDVITPVAIPERTAAATGGTFGVPATETAETPTAAVPSVETTAETTPGTTPAATASTPPAPGTTPAATASTPPAPGTTPEMTPGTTPLTSAVSSPLVTSPGQAVAQLRSTPSGAAETTGTSASATEGVTAS